MEIINRIQTTKTFLNLKFYLKVYLLIMKKYFNILKIITIKYIQYLIYFVFL